MNNVLESNQYMYVESVIFIFLSFAVLIKLEKSAVLNDIFLHIIFNRKRDFFILQQKVLTKHKND